MKKLFATILLTLSLAAKAQEGVRDYASIFDGLNPSAKQVKEVEIFDLFAFVGENDTYVSTNIAARNNKTIKVYYSEKVFFGAGYLSPNINMLNNFAFGLLFSFTRNPESADIIVLGVDEVSRGSLVPYRKELNLFMKDWGAINFDSDVKLADDGRCGAYRRSSDGVVSKTIILVVAPSSKEPGFQDQKPVAACVNRGHYFHIGFSNVMNLDEKFVVAKHSSRDIWGQNPRFLPVLPMSMRDGKYAGDTRTNVLRFLLTRGGN